MLILFASFSIFIINAYIWTFVSKWFFTMWVVNSVTSQTSLQMGVAVCRSGRYSSPYNFPCMINGVPDKKLKYYYVNVNYKNISYYILFVLIILTSSIKNIRPLYLKHWLYIYLFRDTTRICSSFWFLFISFRRKSCLFLLNYELIVIDEQYPMLSQTKAHFYILNCCVRCIDCVVYILFSQAVVWFSEM